MLGCLQNRNAVECCLSVQIISAGVDYPLDLVIGAATSWDENIYPEMILGPKLGGLQTARDINPSLGVIRGLFSQVC